MMCFARELQFDQSFATKTQQNAGIAGVFRKGHELQRMHLLGYGLCVQFC